MRGPSPPASARDRTQLFAVGFCTGSHTAFRRRFRHGIVRSPGHTNLIFDIALPDDLHPRRKEIKTYLDNCLAERCSEQFYTVITFDPGAFNHA